ncbi:hypothetical protein K7957_05375 [Sphingomonas yunnanensis]|uniref:hypothetical protein n=1 Tax=Sphingomonas yunnanensis TaxID=310400 RepID=UPI001CA75ED0|nr:hypothetical protein [Sphingomonas yunnanensis]MBY9062361.1 hypothetical protein [Sphingomonas yunnanensis]
MQSSTARLAVRPSDAHYVAVLALVRELDAISGDSTYNLGKRNGVTFVREAARRAGIATVDFPNLMKKPASFLRAVAAANAAQVRVIEQDGKAYLAENPPLDGAVPVEAPVSTPGTLPGKEADAKR